MFTRLASVPASVASFASRFTTTVSVKEMPNLNKRVPGADKFYPLNEPAIGTPYSAASLQGTLHASSASHQVLFYRTSTLRTKPFPICSNPSPSAMSSLQIASSSPQCACTPRTTVMRPTGIWSILGYVVHRCSSCCLSHITFRISLEAAWRLSL
jgi:hypothetical protein